MTQPVREKPTHPFDVVAAVGMALVLWAMCCPLNFLIVRHMAAPKVDTRAAYERGAVDMCVYIGKQLEVGGDLAAACTSMVAEME